MGPTMVLARSDRLLTAGIALFVGLVWTPSLRNGFVLDDKPLILDNAAIGKWSFLWKGFVNEFHWFKYGEGVQAAGNYRPLEAAVVGISYHLFGRWPMGWHAVPIVFHLLAVVAVFEIARILSSDRTVGALAAASFAVIPTQAGAVAYCSAIEPLAGALILWSFVMAVDRKGPGRLTESVLLYTAALLSYEGAILLPVLVAAHASLLGPDRDGTAARRLRAAIGAALPFVPLTILYLGARLWVMGLPVAGGNNTTMAEALMTLPSAVLTYVLLLVWPFSAGPVHPLVFVTTVQSPRFYFPALLLALLATLSIGAMIRSVRRRLYVFCVVWVVLTLSPVLILSAHVAQFMIQDRWLYIPMFGWSLLISSGLVAFARWNRSTRRMVTVAGIVLGCAWVFSLWHTQAYWKDGVAFYTQCVKVAPREALYHKGLGWEFFERGSLDGAEQEFKQVCRLDPGDAVAAYNLASVHAQMGREREAVRETAAALERIPKPPVGAYLWLAQMYDKFGQLADRDAAWAQAATLPGGREAVLLEKAKALRKHLGRQ